MKSIRDIYSTGYGPYTIPARLTNQLGNRERAILKARDCASFPHKLNKDCDFYCSDDCIEYYSPTEGKFTYNSKTNLIVG